MVLLQPDFKSTLDKDICISFYDDAFEFFVSLKNICLLLHHRGSCSAGFLRVYDWSDAANSEWACTDQVWKTLLSLTELTSSFVVPLIRVANDSLSQSREWGEILDVLIPHPCTSPRCCAFSIKPSLHYIMIFPVSIQTQQRSPTLRSISTFFRAVWNSKTDLAIHFVSGLLV